MCTVIFPSGGAASTAMLGGHVDVVPITAAFAASMLRNGQVRLLAVAAPTRLPGVLADVPTWREQGYDAVVSNWRIFIGPKGMTAAQITYWEEALRRMADSEEWKKELEASFWTSEYKGSIETRKYRNGTTPSSARSWSIWDSRGETRVKRNPQSHHARLPHHIVPSSGQYLDHIVGDGMKKFVLAAVTGVCSVALPMRVQAQSYPVN